MNNTGKFQACLILTVPLGILSTINMLFTIPLAIGLLITIYFISKMETTEKPIAYYYLGGVIIIILPMIFIENPYTLLVSELVIYFILVIGKNIIPKKIKVKIIEKTKKHTIIEITKSFSHPFPTGLYAVRATKKKGIQFAKWKQTLFGPPELIGLE